MADARNIKTIAERVDLGFPRRGNWLRTWRWRASLVALAVAMLLPGWSAYRHNQRLYEAGGLSDAHQFIANDCRRCHAEKWRTALRLVTFDDQLPSVLDAACVKCHAGPPHHKNERPADTRCTSCHREHRGRHELSRIADRLCTQCHRELQTSQGPSANFQASIENFAAHPEFAVLRGPAAAQPGPGHGVHEVAQAGDGKWLDRSTLRFNHQKHTGPQGLLRRDGTKRPLNCEHCHQLDASSGRMRPINHERHCADCHGNQLHFDESQFPNTSVTHGPVAIVRGELVDRYATLAAKTPELAQEAPIDPEREVPGQPRLSASGWPWVNGRINSALDHLLSRERLGCRYCHKDVRFEDDKQAWIVADPRVPSRWLKHGVFRHDRHQPLACTACHQHSVESGATEDILLPGIESCRQCHGSQNVRGSARADCVECHLYHHGELKTIDGPYSLDLSAAKTRNAPTLTRRVSEVSRSLILAHASGFCGPVNYPGLETSPSIAADSHAGGRP